MKSKKGQLSSVAQTGLIYMVVRGVIVLLFYLILVMPYTSKITNETIAMVVNIIIFIIALAFVIGSGKGVMKLGKIFSFSRK